MVAGEECIPFAGPDDFDDIPAGATEEAFELLHDFAIAANRAIEALEVAIDDKGQVVEVFAGPEGESPQGFWLIAFAVA